MVDLANELEYWFSQRPKWLQEAAVRLLENGNIVESDVKDLILICKHEAGVCQEDLLFRSARKISKSDLMLDDSGHNIQLISLADVNGVMLSPLRIPLF